MVVCMCVCLFSLAKIAVVFLWVFVLFPGQFFLSLLGNNFDSEKFRILYFGPDVSL